MLFFVLLACGSNSPRVTRLEDQQQFWPSMREFSAWFLDENFRRSGMQRMANGLQYEVLKSGRGKSSPLLSQRITILLHKAWYPAPTSSGVVQFEQFGHLRLDSFSRIPIYAPGGRLVHKRVTSCADLKHKGQRGLAQALQQMKAGDKWQIYVPDSLAPVADGKVRVHQLTLLKVAGDHKVSRA